MWSESPMIFTKHWAYTRQLPIGSIRRIATQHRACSLISIQPTHLQYRQPSHSTMPLRARINNPAFRNMSYSAQAPLTTPQYTRFTPQASDDPTDVLFNSHYGARTIELNRPQKLNSLNASMARKIIPRLIEWAKSDLCQLVIIGGTGPKAFCAGGDVAALVKELASQNPAGREAAKAYFNLEYTLDHMIAMYPKPYIAYLDGITMGGGVGLSVHAPIRIATERTVFAMPETTIGFFPDVGGSFFLPRCLDGRLGAYLALTSDRLSGANVFYAGIATHYIDSATLPALTGRLAELQFPDAMGLSEKLSLIDGTIAEFDTGLPFDQPIQGVLTSPIREAIDRCFKFDRLEDIVDALSKEHSSSITELSLWAKKTSHILSSGPRSPTSLKVTLQQLKRGQSWTISETFRNEYNIACNFISSVPDFVTGVSARLLTKPAQELPAWNPSSMEMTDDASIDKLFTSNASSSGSPSKSASDDLKLIDIMAEAPRPRIPAHGEYGFEGLGDYTDYPFHELIGLPRESSIREHILKTTSQNKVTTQSTVVQEFERRRKGRFTTGIKEKVGSVVARCCETAADGNLRWKEA